MTNWERSKTPARGSWRKTNSSRQARRHHGHKRWPLPGIYGCRADRSCWGTLRLARGVVDEWFGTKSKGSALRRRGDSFEPLVQSHDCTADKPCRRVTLGHGFATTVERHQRGNDDNSLQMRGDKPDKVGVRGVHRAARRVTLDQQSPLKETAALAWQASAKVLTLVSLFVDDGATTLSHRARL
jgi:hypothetical protein